MTISSPFTPSQEEEALLFRRLCDADADAPADIVQAYLPSLVLWLRDTHHYASEHDCYEAAEDAIVRLVKSPSSYDPQRQTLQVYLRLSARGDLLNLLRRERRHKRRHQDWNSVELSDRAGKYLGRDDDPSLPLRTAEAEATHAAQLRSVREGLTDAEGRVLELLLSGERRTPAYAEAYGVAHLPPKEQQREVKRVKDRLKKRLKRAGGDHDRPG